MVSYEQVLPAGEVLKPFGDAPSGLILYLADGRMSVHISVGMPKKLANEDPFKAGPADAAEAWREYFGYWGTFKVHAEKGTVVHRVEGSSFSNWIGTEQERHFRFEGADRLILETQSSSGLFTVVWRRLGAVCPG